MSDQKKSDRKANLSLALTFAFGLCSLFGITIAPSKINLNDPVHATVFAIVMLVSGVWLGGYAHSRIVNAEVQKAEAVRKLELEREEAKRKAEEEVKDQELERKVMKLIREARVCDKEALVEAFDCDPVFIEDPDGWSSPYDFGTLKPLVRYETVKGGRKWTVQPGVRDILEKYPELLDEARENLAEAERTASRRRFFQDPNFFIERLSAPAARLLAKMVGGTGSIARLRSDPKDPGIGELLDLGVIDYSETDNGDLLVFKLDPRAHEELLGREHDILYRAETAG